MSARVAPVLGAIGYVRLKRLRHNSEALGEASCIYVWSQCCSLLSKEMCVSTLVYVPWSRRWLGALGALINLI